MNLKKIIREVADFPIEGIGFKDITTLYNNVEAFDCVVKSVVEEFKDKGITKVVGLEARGFVFGGAIAHALQAGFVPVRKKEKLPYEVIYEEYDLEYGSDRVEMHKDSLNENDVVLIHDDLLATGGTAYAALQLVKRLNVSQVYFNFVIDLSFLKSEKKSEILEKYHPQILVTY